MRSQILLGKYIFELIRGGGFGGLFGNWARAVNPGLQAVHVEIDDGSGEEREHLADDEATDDGDAEWLAKFGAGAAADGEWNCAEQRGHGGHHDGTETQDASFVNGVNRGFSFDALGLQREIDHHDCVLFNNSDEQNNSDERDDVEVGVEKENCEQRADSG